MAAPLEHRNESVLTYLILGDGDFTFSLDLARYLQHQEFQQRHSLTIQLSSARIHLIATGFDSFTELKQKYKDSPFILKSLRECSTPLLQIDVRHGVNAVASDYDDDVASDDQIQKAHHVIFNHPHLGTEDCIRHYQFLSHLFHACRERWLIDSDCSCYLHVTLAHQQAHRWKCLAAAERHGFHLVHRVTFQSPPLSKHGQPSYYQVRRHQTGKSFGNRVAGPSETLTFALKATHGDKSENDDAVTSLSHPLPWYSFAPSSSDSAATPAAFTCQYCSRSFREERSLNSHLLAKHVGDDDDADLRPRKKPALTCSYCPSETKRTYSSENALAEHVLAKHSGPHTKILPDWSISAKMAANTVEESCHDKLEASFGKCSVCDKVFATESELLAHETTFLPSSSLNSGAPIPSVHACSYCKQNFGDQRARLQHENKCAQHHASVE
ncbi:hypothetical protein MPSEU_000597700 [Mayamaea pseudoterrestris]|nr:hypothetical protein MPSEU_000597700 [Mayamaea pseudoterrestris]